ncbi:substrate-binding domain-containing protein [Streptomyces sp. NPDC053755]|uniref:substrate-binding domain-containing protein n=1 Tax=Streptomyces sp. NPDC053755 TaxID=3155815 RepID=UPI00341E4551
MNELSGALHPGAEAEGRVPLGADPLLMEQRVGHLIRETRYRYPKVQVSPRATSVLNVAEAVLRGELPLALVALEEGAPPLPAEVTAEKLPSLPLVPVGSPSLAAAGDLARALRSVRVLTINAECTCHLPLLAALRSRYGIDAPVIEAGSVGGVRELARSGYGVAMLPPEPSLAAQHLAVIPTLPSCELDVRVLYAQPEHLSRAARSVLELMRRLPLPAAGTDRIAAVTSLSVLNSHPADGRPLRQIAS